MGFLFMEWPSSLFYLTIKWLALHILTGTVLHNTLVVGNYHLCPGYISQSYMVNDDFLIFALAFSSPLLSNTTTCFSLNK